MQPINFSQLQAWTNAEHSRERYREILWRYTGMIEARKIQDGNKIIIFCNNEDFENYSDYVKNGLKVIRTEGRSYFFNDGSRLTNVAMNGQPARYTLLKGNRTITSEKMQKKYIAAIV